MRSKLAKLALLCYNTPTDIKRSPWQVLDTPPGLTAEQGSGKSYSSMIAAAWQAAFLFGGLLPTRGNRMSRYAIPPGEQMRRNQMFAQGFLWCNECKQFKAVKLFYKIRTPKDRTTNYGYRFYCIECDNTKKRNKTQKKQYYKEKNFRLKRQFVDLAGGSCQRCGHSEFITGLDFHHVYPSEKKYSPTIIIYSNNFKKTWAELDKCCLLCATCHAAYTGNEWKAEFIKREGLGWTVGQPLPLNDDRYDRKPERVEQAPFPLHLLKFEPVQLSF